MAASRNKPSVDLPGRVGAFLAARLKPESRLCVGLSGGCDSVVLLHLLSRLGYAGRLSARHVNHGLSPNAAAWADFCTDYCGQLEVPLEIKVVTVDARSGLGLEAAARQARYAAFAESTADCLLLAQHRGDQAETVLFNLLRGTGLVGAAGMLPERQMGGLRILRPLLDVSRHEIETYAAEQDLRWVTDESNADTQLTRNFLRHDVLTALAARFPGAESSLALAASHFAEAASLLDDLAAQDWQGVEADNTARLAGLKVLSLPRLKNLLRHRLRVLGWRVPVATRLDEFCRQLISATPDRHPELDLPDGKMRLSRGYLHWLSRK